MIQTYTVQNTLGATLTLCNLGASILSFKNKEGMECIVGDKDPHYITAENYPYFGLTVGPLAGRTRTTPFTVNKKSYTVPANENKDVSLHGGATRQDISNNTSPALSFCEWEHTELEHTSMQGYIFHTTVNAYNTKASIQCLIALKNKENTIHIEYKVTADSPFPINLTNHSYFNLGESTILNHTISIPASYIYRVNALGLATGELMYVRNSPLDVHPSTAPAFLLKDCIDALKHDRNGLDHTFKIDHNAEKHNASIALENTNRILHLAGTLSLHNYRLRTFTTCPAVVCYTGNFLNKYTAGEKAYSQYEAICFETQYPSGFTHIPTFPQSVADTTKPCVQCTEYVFDV